MREGLKAISALGSIFCHGVGRYATFFSDGTFLKTGLNFHDLVIL